MSMRSSPRGGRPTSLGGPLADKQCCCPGSQEHVTSAGLGRASQQLWQSKLPVCHIVIRCGRVSACV